MGFVSDAMGKGGSKAPPAPDYTQAAIATANANKYNTSGPYGSGTWALRPGADANNPQAGDWTQTVTLGPQEQGLYDQGVQNRQGAAQATGAMLGDLGDRQTIADALYRKSTQYMDQNFGDQERALETKLQNQGLVMGSQAYDNAMRNFQQTRGQAYEGAASNATINADTAQNNAVQRIAQMLGLGNLGVAAFKAGIFSSDRRLKSNIVEVGEQGGLKVYEYEIFGQRERGYMADEVAQLYPEAVHKDPSGYLKVDYDAIGGRP